MYNVEWEPGPLNVLVGPNASGKSNVLRLFEMIAASSRGNLERYVQREGGMDSVLWDGTDDSLFWRIRTTPVYDNLDPVRHALTYELRIGRLGTTGSFTVEHEQLGKFYEVEQGWRGEPFKLLHRRSQRAVIFDTEEKSLSAPE